MINKLIPYIKDKEKPLEKIKEKIKQYRFLIKPFLYITIIFIIGISAIIRADFSYIDDLERAAEGVAGWSNFSRYLSDFFSTIIHCDTYLTDVSPLPQLLCACIMAFAGIIIIYVYKNDKKITFWNIIAIIPLGLSPYFLECFSYKYDAPYMGLSVLASVFPLLFRKKEGIIYPITIILCTLVMCMTYQASSGIFLMFTLLLFLKDWNEKKSNKENFLFLIISGWSYLIGLLIFKTFIMQVKETYVVAEMFPIKYLHIGVMGNYGRYMTHLKADFKTEWFIIMAIMAVFFVYTFVRDSKRKKYIALPVTIIILTGMWILSFGMYLVLIEPLFAPRGMYGVGVFIALMGVAISSTQKIYPGKIVILAMSWIFFVFAFTYGNALNAQEEYYKFRINLIAEDLNDLESFATEEIKYVQLAGYAGKAPIIKNMRQDYQILNRLVPNMLNFDWSWGTYYFFNYMDLKNVEGNQYDYENERENENEDFKDYNMPILKDTMYHTIRGDGQKFLIEVK